MKKEKSNNQEIDGLLKEVLKDDLSPEMETRMKRRFILFRKKIEESERQQRININTVWRRLFRKEAWHWAHWILKKEILAFSSIIMVIIGGVMHISGHPSALTESFSMMKMLVYVSEEVRHTSSMECMAQVAAQDGKILNYSIRWISPDKTRVDVRKADEINKILWVLDEDITIADCIKNTLYKIESIEQINDSVFQPVMGFLSPAEFSELVYTRWQPELYELEEGRDWGTFTFTNHEENAFLEVTIDLNTYLPVNIKKFLHDSIKTVKKRKLVMEAHFTWNQPVLPQLMVPKSQKGDKVPDVLSIKQERRILNHVIQDK